MWISKRKWTLMQTDVMAIRGEIEEISKLLGIPFYNRIAGRREEPGNSKLCLARELLSQAARLLDETSHQERNP